MTKVPIKDIRQKSYENWNHYKYEQYNQCPCCEGVIRMKGSVNNLQFFECLSCGQTFILNAVTEEIELRNKEELHENQCSKSV